MGPSASTIAWRWSSWIENSRSRNALRAAPARNVSITARTTPAFRSEGSPGKAFRVTWQGKCPANSGRAAWRTRGRAPGLRPAPRAPAAAGAALEGRLGLPRMTQNSVDYGDGSQMSTAMCHPIRKISENRTRGRPRDVRRSAASPPRRHPTRPSSSRFTRVRLGSPDATSYPAHGRGLPAPIASVRSRPAMPDRGYGAAGPAAGTSPAV